mgnify:FL=1
MWWQKKKHISRQGLRVLSRPIVLAIIIIIVSFVSIVSSKTAQAGKYDDWMNDEFKKYANSSAARACSEYIRSDNKFDPLNPGTWGVVKDGADFINGLVGNPKRSATSIRPIGRRDSKDPNVDCNISEIAEGVTGEKNYFCNYLKKNSQGYIDAGLIKGDNAKAHLDNCDLSPLQISPELWIGALDSIPKYTPSNAVKYAAYRDAIEKYCLNDPAFTEAENGDKFWSKVGDDGNWVTVRGYPNYKDNNPNVEIRPMYGETMTCAEATQKASELADAYTKAVNEYLEKHPEEREKQKKEEEERSENQKGDECASELHGFGSIICSGQNLFVTITQVLFNTVAKILESQAELTKEDAVRQQWGNLLNVANAILIIAFLVVIYSTATSTGGLSNYDVKKLLPRIIIFAMAINLSYYICMALVDLSNILGHGIFGLFLGGKAGDAPQLVDRAKETAQVISPGVEVITTVAIVAILIFLVGPPIIIALLTILFALVVRGMALMILVIISPVAIASYLFNSQGLSNGFTMWRDNYIKLLLVYPLFMLVWAGSRVVSSLNPNSPDAALAIFGLLMEVICLVAPAMSILPLFKMSGDIMGKATIAAQNNRGANKFADWAGSKFVGKPGDPNSPGLRGKAAGVIGAAAGAAAGRVAGAVQNARGAASTGNIANQLDDQAMNSARNKVDKYSASDRHDAFTTGQINGQTLKPYEMRAVIEKELPNASSTDVKQSMHAVNNEAQRLKKNGQNADADKLLRTFATTASANKNSQMSSKSLNDFANSGGWSMGQFEAKYADAVADYATNEMTAQDIASTDAANLAQMRQTLQYSADSGGSEAAADAGMRSMARQSNIALSDPSLTSKMNAQTASELRDNTLLRSTAGEKLANTHKIPNIYHDYNAGGGSSTLATLHAKKMMLHSDFGKLDAIDQSRLRAIAGASVHMTPGAPATPVAIASWDRRA